MSGDKTTDEPLSPACMKCEAVTGKDTCFPGPCVFYLERNTPGTKAYNVATLDGIRRGKMSLAAGECPDDDDTLLTALRLFPSPTPA